MKKRRRLPDVWRRWCRNRKRQFKAEGLQADVASKFADAEAFARASAARAWGRTAAERATLTIEFLPNGAMRGFLTGTIPNWRVR